MKKINLFVYGSLREGFFNYDKYLSGKEVEVDAVCDGHGILIPGIMEHVERTGVHSGDSISIYPTFTASQNVKDKIIDYKTYRFNIIFFQNLKIIFQNHIQI